MNKMLVCNRCGTLVTKSEVDGYTYYCPEHDEDLYNFETNKTTGGFKMQKIDVEIVRDFDGTYYANVSKNGELVDDLPEYVNYRTLKKAIRDKINFQILPMKALKFERFGRKEFAYFNNYDKVLNIKTA